MVEANKLVARRCSVAHTCQYYFEVTLLGNRFVVDLNARACTCKYFDIRGIMCSHAIACIQWIRHDSATLVSDWFKKDAYKAAYSRGIPPMNGLNLWNENEGVCVFPHVVRRQPGRPKQRRRVVIGERDIGSILSKKGIPQTCSICHEVGHNRKSCTRRRVQDATKVCIRFLSNCLSMVRWSCST